MRKIVMSHKKTIVGRIHPAVLAFTVGKDPVLDLALLEADCLGTAAHVAMLAKLPLRPRLFPPAQRRQVTDALLRIMRRGSRGAFRIRSADQDVHLAVERVLTAQLGDLGRRVHTARSRNDQVATDLRLYGKMRMLDIFDESLALIDALLDMARRHVATPMVGRTHLQPAMPSSAGLWFASYAEGLLDDADLLKAAFEMNDRNPLGSAAGYGVPLALDRDATTAALGFREPIRNVLYAATARGKCESAILSALAQTMLTLSRMAEDMTLFCMPEFGYFALPRECSTGSSIMPQKNNPDVYELVRAKAGRVLGCATAATSMVKGLPGGYNRDLQEIKEAYMVGLDTTCDCLRILAFTTPRLEVRAAAMLRGFTPDVFATDRVLERVQQGESFRNAYDHVKARLGELADAEAATEVCRRPCLADPGLREAAARAAELRTFARERRARLHAALAKLLGTAYPDLGDES
jgi:argininosuccinate lyase